MAGIIEAFIQSYGVLGFFVAVVIEEIIVPLPSSMIMLAGGFFLISATSLNQAIPEILFKLTIPGTIGVTLGSLFFYFLSFYGRESIVKKIGPKFGFSYNESEKLKRFFHESRWDEFAVFLLRALPIFPGVAVSVIAGLIKMPLLSFFITGFFGSAIRVFIMGFLGWQAKEAYAILALKFENISNLIFIGFIFSVILVYVIIKKGLKQE
ncbi:MAG: hypothetical protein A2418_00940 [Candidatus Brennerbacteria bacterium RIFOXYC1_FULL_41_11]|uniref:VTT domain-containing protein n=1 Tax=Candidatus Brennerbacteria bacterium RIFOXYD1_FULL_41_16 TaxID=1797529 RepID=A0A1G1XLM1_9BACT|nr:MAG: hypothetical protein UU61_C0036G0014 [Parcubacteria group bacterium GW2011_GWB1_41_4]OGY38604.1 MAG: hypothetical protein A2391_03370 [Candidatus Brennerbacteria bacterium RIFOXYB1_FULL_41_13]OGY38867.1 MAG: hypothetical protein A2418_00940 [Candidatus Brennerbacteria bacterium RIFOXYC1_FULL_41_11]OGY41025.1 MAG: hypothetical protein A2570_00065 [Candidatus Brennerbacteria bacterium RIFOXYD1_FULL_41_16]